MAEIKEDTRQGKRGRAKKQQEVARVVIIDGEGTSPSIEIRNSKGVCGVGVVDEQGNLTITITDDSLLEINSEIPFENINVNSQGAVRLCKDSSFDNIQIKAKKTLLEDNVKIVSSLNIDSINIEQRGVLDLQNVNVMIESQSINCYGDMAFGEKFKIDAESLTLRKKAKLSCLTSGKTKRSINLSKAMIVGADATFDCKHVDLKVDQARINGKAILANSTVNADQFDVRSRRTGHSPVLLLNGTTVNTNNCQYNGDVSILCSELNCNKLTAYQKVELINSNVTASQYAAVMNDCEFSVGHHSKMQILSMDCKGSINLKNQSLLDCEQLGFDNQITVNNSFIKANGAVEMLNKQAKLILRNNSFLQTKNGLLDGVVQFDDSSFKGTDVSIFANMDLDNGKMAVDQMVGFQQSNFTAIRSNVGLQEWYMLGSADLKQSELDGKKLAVHNDGFSMSDSKANVELIDAQAKIKVNNTNITSDMVVVEKQADLNQIAVKSKKLHFGKKATVQIKNSKLDYDTSFINGATTLQKSLSKGKKTYVTGDLQSTDSKIQSEEVFVDKQATSKFTDSLVDAKQSVIICGKNEASNTNETAQVGFKTDSYINAGEDSRNKVSVLSEKKYASTDDSKTTIDDALVYSKGDANIGGENDLRNAVVQSDGSITMLSGSHTSADNASFIAKQDFVNSSRAKIDGSSIHIKCKGFSNMGTIDMGKQFQAEVDTFLNAGSLDGGEMTSIKADLFFVNMLGHLGGKQVDIKSALFNANIFGDISGSESLSMHALANANLYGVQRSWNLSTNGIFNFNAGLQGAFVLPTKWQTVFKLSSLVALSKSILTSLFPEATNTINNIYTASNGVYTHGTHAKKIYDEFKKSDKDLGSYIKDKLSEKSTWADRVSTFLEAKDLAQSAFELSQTDFTNLSDSWMPDFSGFTHINTDGWDIGEKIGQTCLGVLAPTQANHGLFEFNTGAQLSGNLSTQSLFQYNSGISSALQHNSVSSYWQRNDGVTYSLFGMTNLDGHVFENNGVVGSATQSNFRFHHMDCNDGGSVVGGTANYHSHTANLHGEMDVEKAIFDIEEFTEAVELITGENQYANYHVSKKLTVNSNEYLNIDREIKRQCGISAKAKGINFDADYNTKYNLELTTTEDDLIISSTVRAKNIRCKSAKNTTTKGDIQAEDNSVYVSEGYHLNSGGIVKSGKHTFIKAEGEIRNECVETDVQGAYDVMKEYKKGVIAGGTGEDTDGVGLTLVTNDKVINDASTIASVGKNVVIAKKGMEGKSRFHEYTSNVRVKKSGKGVFKKKKVRVTKSAQIEGNEMISTNGKNYIFFEEGGADMTATSFISKNGTDIHTRDEINLYEQKANTSTYKKTSSMGGLFHDRDKSTCQVSKSTVMADNGVSTLQSNQATIHAKGAEFLGDGDTHFKAKKNVLLESEKLATDSERRTSSVKLTSNVTDVGQKLLSDPKSIAEMHPLSNSAKKAAESNNPLEVANEIQKGAQMLDNILQNGISAEGIAQDILGQSGLGDGNGINPTVTTTFSKTETKTHSERMGAGGIDRNNVTIETEGEAKLKGLPVNVRNNMSVKAETFTQEALTCNSSTKTKTQSFSVGASAANPTSPTVGVSESKSSSSSTQHINQRLNVGGNLHVEARNWNMDGANVDTNTISGEVDKLTITSRQNEQQSKSSAASVSSAGSASYSQSSNKSRTVDQRSGIKVRSTESSATDQGFFAKATELTSADIETVGKGQFKTSELTTHELVDEVTSSQYGFSAAVDGSGSNVAVKGNQFASEDKVVQKCFISEAGGYAPEIGKVSGDFVTDASKKTEQLSHTETPGILQSFEFSVPLPKAEAPAQTSEQASYWSDSDVPEYGGTYEEFEPVEVESHDKSFQPIIDEQYDPSVIEMDIWSELDDFAPANQSPMPLFQEEMNDVGQSKTDDQDAKVDPVKSKEEKTSQKNDGSENTDQKNDSSENTDDKHKSEYRPLEKIADGFNLATDGVSKMTNTEEFSKHYGPLGTGLSFFANVDKENANGSDTPFLDAAIDTTVDRVTDYIPYAKPIKMMAAVGKFQQEHDLYMIKTEDLTSRQSNIDEARQEGHGTLAVGHMMTQDSLAMIHGIERLPTYASKAVDKTTEVGAKVIKNGGQKIGTAMAYSQCVQSNAFAPAKFQLDCEQVYLSKDSQSKKSKQSEKQDQQSSFRP